LSILAFLNDSFQTLTYGPEISAKIGTGTQIEDILRTAVQELGMRIGGTQVTVEIGGGE